MDMDISFKLSIPNFGLVPEQPTKKTESITMIKMFLFIFSLNDFGIVTFCKNKK